MSPENRLDVLNSIIIIYSAPRTRGINKYQRQSILISLQVKCEVRAAKYAKRFFMHMCHMPLEEELEKMLEKKEQEQEQEQKLELEEWYWQCHCHWQI